jgi:hypothetical protein
MDAHQAFRISRQSSSLKDDEVFRTPRPTFDVPSPMPKIQP